MRDALAAILPAWARPGHPILGYELARWRATGSYRRAFLVTLLIAMPLATIGYLYALASEPVTFSEGMWRLAVVPCLIVQAATGLLAFGCGVAAFDKNSGRRAWDSLRVTDGGAGLTLRSRWLAILYRLRAPLIALTLSRLVLALGMLHDLTAFGGTYPHIVGGGSAELVVALPLLALQIAVTFTLPFVTTGLAAALGIVISVVVRDRLFALILQALLSVVYIALSSGTLLLNLRGASIAHDSLRFALALAQIGLIDWGLAHSHLGGISEIWRQSRFGIGLPAASALLVIVMATLIDGCLAVAVRLTEGTE